jgi:hypothetical protein
MTQTLFDILSDPDTVQKEEVKEVKKPVAEGEDRGKLDFFSMASQQEEQPEELGYWKSVLNSIPKGAVKGLIQFGRMMGPLPDTQETVDSQGNVIDEQKYEPEKIAAQLDEWFPTTEDFVPGAIERGLGMAPTILGSPGGLLAGGGLGTATRIGAASAAGEGAKQAGMPEWVQTISETVPLLAPSLSAANKAGASEGVLAKIIADKAPQKIADRVKDMMTKNATKKELLDFARQAGMKESEITPLLQGEMKQKWLTKLASKGESTQAKLKASQESIGNVFNSIKESPAAQKVFTEKQSSKLVKSLQDKFEQMPSSVRNVVQEDFQQLLKGEMTGEKVIKFFRDINHELGSKTKQLSTLKDPIKKALMEVDGELGRSFDMTNKLYGKYAEIAKRLKTSEHDKLYAAGKGGIALTGLLTGNFGMIKGLAAYEGSRKLAEHMLTNPRLQNLSTKMISALNQNKFQVAEHLKRQMIDEVKEVDPAVAKALQELNIKSAIEAQ